MAKAVPDSEHVDIHGVGGIEGKRYEQGMSFNFHWYIFYFTYIIILKLSVLELVVRWSTYIIVIGKLNYVIKIWEIKYNELYIDFFWNCH